MEDSMQGFLGEHTSFLEKIFAALERDRIDVSKYELDHICYRVASEERYRELKTELIEFGDSLGETLISGRAIAKFKLRDPILFEDREIDCLELPAPKKNNTYSEGYEHVEFVIDLEFDAFMAKYPQIDFDKKAVSKEINPDIRIRYDDVSVKFHHNTLEYVVKYLQ